MKLVDDWANNYFPMPESMPRARTTCWSAASARTCPIPSGKSISMFVAADQLLKGAALNAVQIAELL